MPRSVYEVLEEMQGRIAAEIRVMLGEAPFPTQAITPEFTARRIEAMKKTAVEADAFNDQERHESWMQMHRDAGWVYGEVFDNTLKTHPNMKPWEELPPAVQSKARIFAIVAKAAAELDKPCCS